MDAPALRGGLLALVAALLFGVSTPLVQWFGRGLGPFTTAALLYLGAALVGAALRRPPSREARLRRADLPRLGAVALAGAVIAPVALAWGLQRASGVAASLLLTLEVVFTVLLARWVYREGAGPRVWGAMAVLTAGALVLVLEQQRGGPLQVAGLLAVLAATAAWAVDSTLSRALAERDPGQVVLGKSVLGAGATLALAAATGEPWPGGIALFGLLAVGATGYGLSLRYYLLAQRAFGAARTASVFAFSPFVGAALALLMGERDATWGMVGAGVLMALGVALHLAERHSHAHVHEPLDHEHTHDHGDGHHDHRHDPMPGGPHSHRHHHGHLQHAHPHVPDAHHQHPH